MNVQKGDNEDTEDSADSCIDFTQLKVTGIVRGAGIAYRFRCVGMGVCVWSLNGTERKYYITKVFTTISPEYININTGGK